MAFVHSAKVKGVTFERYSAVTARHNPLQDLDGLLAWAAGEDENGLNVVTIWQSQATRNGSRRSSSSPRSRRSAWPTK